MNRSQFNEVQIVRADYGAEISGPENLTQDGFYGTKGRNWGAVQTCDNRSDANFIKKLWWVG